MNISIDSRSNPAKKRKVNDGRDDTTKGAHDVDNDGGGFLSSASKSHDVNNIIPQLDRMEQMMMRMAEKLATISSLESRCEQLEAKCSSLENKLEAKCTSLENKLEDKVDELQVRAQQYHEYNSMLVRNQKWDYSADVNPFDLHETEPTVQMLKELKEKTIEMRRGEFPDEEFDEDINVNGKGIRFEPEGAYVNLSFDFVLPHWKEFVAAIKQFTPAIQLLPDNEDSYFRFGNVVLNQVTMMLMKEALIGKPFTLLHFAHNHSVDYEYGGMSIDAILDIVESNKYLQKLHIYHNTILNDHIERLCSIVHNHQLVELDLYESFHSPGVGNAMVTSLLTSGELKLEKLDISANGITSDVTMVLADFLATNPRLRVLRIEENDMEDEMRDAWLIATALRSNTTLELLQLGTESGAEAFWPVLCDQRSLNALADSNHRCQLSLYGFPSYVNSHEVIAVNRGLKIYDVLSLRNMSETMSNVQHFGDIDVKLLPNMLDAVQKYAKFVYEDEDDDLKVESLSIVYEVMRKWEKVFNLYQSSR